MKNPCELFDAAGVEYGGISVDSISYFIICLPYLQHTAEKSGYAFIDNYFVSSNAVYFLKKRLSAQLEEEGFITVDEIPFQYKYLAYYSGIGEILRSTLLATKKYGTRTALEIIAVRGVFFDEMRAEEIVAPPVSERCKSCKSCEKSCPAKCIGDEFEWRKCIRNMQNGGFIEDEGVAQAMGNCVWGCDICQRVCPANSGQPSTDCTGNSLYSLEALFAAFSGGRAAMEPYRELLGGNYLRPARMLSLVINAMTNDKNAADYKELVGSVRNHTDERVRKAAERYFHKL